MNVDRIGGQVSSADLGQGGPNLQQQQQGQINSNQQARGHPTGAKKPRIASFNQNRRDAGGVLGQQHQQNVGGRPPKSASGRSVLSTQGVGSRASMSGQGQPQQRAPAPHQPGPFPNMLSPIETASLNASLIVADGLEREQMEGSPPAAAAGLTLNRGGALSAGDGRQLPQTTIQNIHETPRGLGVSDWSATMAPSVRHVKHESFGGGPGTEKMLREQDRFLPIANIARIMKRHIPDSGKIAKESKECIQECVSEFVSFITSEASERCLNEKRKTINGEDILWAMQTLGFDPYVEPLKMYLTKYRAACKGDKALEEMGLVPMISLDNENQQEHICISASSGHPHSQAADLSALFQGGGAQGAQFLLATAAAEDGGNNSGGHVTNSMANQLTFLSSQSQNVVPGQNSAHPQQQQMPILYLDGAGFHGNQAAGPGQQGQPHPAAGRPQFITLNQAPPGGVQFVQLVPASALPGATAANSGAAPGANLQHHVITLQPASSAAT